MTVWPRDRLGDFSELTHWSARMRDLTEMCLTVKNCQMIMRKLESWVSTSQSESSLETRGMLGERSGRAMYALTSAVNTGAGCLCS